MRRAGYEQFTLMDAALPDYPVEWEVLPPALFGRLVASWRGSHGRTRHLVETKGRMYVRRFRRSRDK